MTKFRRPALTRRSFVTGGAALTLAMAGFPGMGLMGLSPVAHAQASNAEAQKIADHFSRVRTMAGEFVQFGPRGEQTGGKFFIERPGKVRFNYEPPARINVVSDGRSVVVSNDKLKTNDVYSLGSTPLKLLLDERIDLSGNRVRDVRTEDDLTTITLQDRSVFGNSTITMMFDPQSYDLRQWTITDAQGRDTTVMIFDVQAGVNIDPSVFAIDYRRIQESNTRRR